MKRSNANIKAAAAKNQPASGRSMWASSPWRATPGNCGSGASVSSLRAASIAADTPARS